jgi:Zn-dependent protease with chaperone function
MSDKPRNLFNARYMDGDKIRPMDVSILIEDGLKIVETDELGKEINLLAQWSYEDIRSHDAPSHILIISNIRNENYERLEIQNPEAIKQLKENAPKMGRVEKAEAAKSHKIAALSIGALVSAAIIVIIAIPWVADIAAPLVPPNIERKLGDSVKDQIAQAFGHKTLEAGTCHSQEGDEALALMVNKITSHVDFPYELDVRVVKHKMPNAFALPGGQVIILNSMLDLSTHPDEVFGVLAHELGHVKHKDGLRLIIQAAGRSFFISMLLGDFTGSTVVVFAIQSLLHLSYSREVEHQADLFAIEQLKHHRIATKPMGDLLERMTAHMEETMKKKFDDHGDSTTDVDKPHNDKTHEHDKNQPAKASLLDSHPLTENRKKLLSRAETNTNTVPSLTQAEWIALKNICNDK